MKLTWHGSRVVVHADALVVVVASCGQPAACFHFFLTFIIFMIYHMFWRKSRTFGSFVFVVIADYFDTTNTIRLSSQKNTIRLSSWRERLRHLEHDGRTTF